MCGVAGCVGPSGSMPLLADPTVLAHRGPDAYAEFRDNGVALQHWRLAIIDITAAGAQPMTSADGRYTLTYNGEIYNAPELRRMLERDGATFRGRSDTEVLVEAIARWGLDRTLRRCVGMFAFGVWDRHERTISLARDRFGEKPLYYAWYGERFVFASELRALRSLPGFDPEVDRDALSQLLLVNYIPDPLSIRKGVRRVQPGTYLTVDAERPGAEPIPIAYWSSTEAASRAMATPFEGSETEAVDRLEQLCLEAVGSRMLSDVPLGAFLSGGVDSSLVVSLMQARADRPVSTFAIGFTEATMNEAPYAAAVARHLGTDHHEWIVSGDDAAAVVPQLPEIFDEPLADYSQIPTYLVSSFARQSVTVALSGDGGDELFGGYQRYLFSEGAGRLLHHVPASARHLAADLLQRPDPAAWERLRPTMERLRPGALGVGNLGDRIQRLASTLGGDDQLGHYRGLMSYWDEPVVLGVSDDPPPTPFERHGLVLCNATELMMELDVATYLPGDILTKVDRAAMAVSLETRAPLLDHHLHDFAWSVPLQWRVDRRAGKKILRSVLHRHVPAELVERRKTPFGAPLASWLRGPLRPWAEDLLSVDRLQRDGYLDPAPIRRRWQEHQRGDHNWHHHLWSVLMFNAWLDRWNTPVRSTIGAGERHA